MTRATALALVVLAAALLLPALADASNRRIAISDYKWSDDSLHLDLGEHVTWYWTGPDTMHSVTGQPPNATQWDSDPGTLPQHNIGDDYQVDVRQARRLQLPVQDPFAGPGHVAVSNTPGDPDSEPDPVPKSNVDLKKPVLRDARVPAKFGPRGAPLQYSLSEHGKLDVEYYRYKGKGKPKFAGYATYKAHVGYNRARVGERKPHFKPKRGRYMIELRATDNAHNTSKVQRLRFRIW